MSRNVISPLSLGSALLASALVSTGVGWTSSSTARDSWSPPEAMISDGLCSRACEVQACLQFAEDPADASRECAMHVALVATDLRRAGPDQACVEQCASHGSPVSLSLISPEGSTPVGLR